MHAEGWVVAHRSFGAQLRADEVDHGALRQAVALAERIGDVRELDADDVAGVLVLDDATRGDYPGGAATAHRALTGETALPTQNRRAFGVVVDAGIVAVTYVDIDVDRAETDFTVVHRDWRNRGLARAVKAASVLALTDSGVQIFRTGGSFENAGIRAANVSLGYREDEHWVTLEKPSD